MTICHGCLITAAVCSITDQYSFRCVSHLCSLFVVSSPHAFRRTNFVYQLTEALGVLLVTYGVMRVFFPFALA